MALERRHTVRYTATPKFRGFTRGDLSSYQLMQGGPTASEPPFQLRGTSFTIMVLKIVDPCDTQFFHLLADKVRQAPGFFRNAPIVIDLDGLGPKTEVDFARFSTALRDLGLMVVGLQGGGKRQQAEAAAAGFALLPARATRAEVMLPPKATDERAPEIPYQRSTRIVTEPVRSGRQIYAQNGDLVITAMVSPGAELLADGSIHVYGALRGRALAGVSGDSAARIFCHCLEAELVSIAGIYQLSEDMGANVLSKQVQVYLHEGHLRIEPLTF